MIAKTRTFLKWIFITLTVLLVGYVVLTLASNFGQTLLGKSLEVEEKFLGIFSNETQESTKTFVVFVHGIGSHCIGYSQQMMEGIATNGGYYGPAQTSKMVAKGYDEKSCTTLGSYTEVTSPMHDRERTNSGEKTCTEIWSDSKLMRDINEDTGENCKLIRYGGEVLGFVRKFEFLKDVKNGAGQKSMVGYEIVWDPSTSFVKSKYLNFLHSLTANQMYLFNEWGKDSLLHNKLADAVLYISDYKSFMQYPLAIGFCEVLMDAAGVYRPNEQSVDCGYERARELAKLSSQGKPPGFKGEIVLITHSLGSRMVFDTLVDLQTGKFLRKICEDYYVSSTKDEVDNICGTTLTLAHNLRDLFNQKLNKIYMMSNQIPLLSMPLQAIDELKIQKCQKEVRGTEGSSIEGWEHCVTSARSTSENAIGSRLSKLVTSRKQSTERMGKTPKELQWVSFTEPNDLLNYNLKCWIKTGSQFRRTEKYAKRKTKEYKTALHKLVHENPHVCDHIFDQEDSLTNNSIQICRNVVAYLKNVYDADSEADLLKEFNALRNTLLYAVSDNTDEALASLDTLKNHTAFLGATYWPWLSSENAELGLNRLFSGLQVEARATHAPLDELMSINCDTYAHKDALEEVFTDWEKDLDMNLVNVGVRMGIELPWIFKEPGEAHSGYWTSSEIHSAIARGREATR
ncbi:MAG: hypothetical protein AB2551_07970 [Candidatus Thiodiazotropha sp.]